MQKKLVYDLPTRLFHWLFALSFLSAFIIAKTVDDESIRFTYHMIIGLCLGFLVLLRILWGFLGTRHARFANFALSPKDLISYMQGLLSGDKKKWAGHNPASSYSSIAMMVLALSLGITGFLMTSTPDKELYEEFHELLANSFIIVVILHIGGIFLHTIRHKEMIAISMIDGNKSEIIDSETISNSHPKVAVVFLALITVFALNLLKNYDAQLRTLSFFGTSLHLGENENDGHHHKHGEHSRSAADQHHDDDDDDDDDD